MKVAFVTGSNKGIGYAIVTKLAEYYGSSGLWDIYLTARNPDLGAEAIKKLKDKGLNVKFHQLDINDLASRKRFLDFMKTNYPEGINLAVNNAAIAYKVDATDPFSEQARVTIATNFTATVDFILECLPYMSTDSRIVNVSSMASHMALKKLSPELYKKFTSCMSLEELRSLISEFVSHAEADTMDGSGWPKTAYGVSKLGLTKASFIIGDTIKNDPRRIVMNSCCPGYVSTDMTSHKGVKTIEEGADTPFYLATLPVGITEPINQFVSDRKIVDWS